MACIYSTAKNMTGNSMREGGVTCSKGPQARTRSQGRCTEDKASAHGTPQIKEIFNSVLQNLHNIPQIMNHCASNIYLNKCQLASYTQYKFY